MSSILSCSLQTLGLMSKDALSHLEKPGSALTSHTSASFRPCRWSSQYKHLSFSTCKVLVIEQYSIYNQMIFRTNNSVVWSIKMAIPTSFRSKVSKIFVFLFDVLLSKKNYLCINTGEKNLFIFIMYSF